MIGHVDGNALAGPLSEVFQFDATLARTDCLSCHDVAMLAEAMVYGDNGHGLVVRCRNCNDVLMVIVPEPQHTMIDLRGLAWLQIPRQLS